MKKGMAFRRWRVGMDCRRRCNLEMVGKKDEGDVEKAGHGKEMVVGVVKRMSLTR